MKAKNDSNEIQSRIEKVDSSQSTLMKLKWLVSHLDDSYTLSETFPVGFNIYRKDRVVGGGGVFLGIKDTLVSVEEPTLDTNAELIWAKIHTALHLLILSTTTFWSQTNSRT